MEPPSTSFRYPLIAAGMFGLTGVALGAFGAHGLAAELAERGMTRSWETASRYHLIHSLALLAAAIWLRVGAGSAARLVSWAIHSWSVGIILFSGSLYGLGLGGPRWLGPITPFGGLVFMAGWACVVAAAFKKA